jgi:hypothetical protein
MRTRNGRHKVLFGTNCPMIFHEPALADLDALALDDEASALYLSANVQRLFEEGPRRLVCLGERERAGGRVWCPQRTTTSSDPRTAARPCSASRSRRQRAERRTTPPAQPQPSSPAGLRHSLVANAIARRDATEG